MPRDPYQYFRPEARELLDQLNQGVLELERGTTDVIPQLLRLAHTLKGAARVVRQGAIADHAHAIEDALTAFRQTPAALRPERIDALFKMLDAVAGLMAALTSPAAPTAVASVESPPDETFKGLRADLAEMDALLEGITESHAQLSTFRRVVAAVDRGSRLADLLVEQLKPRAREQVALAGAAASGTAGELRHLFGGIERQLQAAIDQTERELRQVRETVEQLRLIPASAMFTSLERTVRDAARMLGKAARFEARGGHVRLESQVIATMQGAMLQLARNAVAHGIEPAADRTARGKPAVGRVTVDVVRRGRDAVFRCEDDGGGIDLEEVRRMAASRRLSPAQTAALNAQDLTRLLLNGGISTSAAVTEVAGRGIGLDIVRTAAEHLKGKVNVRTARDTGTTFEIVVPLALASLEALVVEAGGIAAAIPLDAVRKALHVATANVSRTARRESVVDDGTAIPFLSLSQALHSPSGSSRAARTASAIVVAGEQGTIAVGVDRVVGTARVVVRPLPDLVEASPVVGGAYLDGDGNPQLVLDAESLVAAARDEVADHSEAEPAPLSVLVIDDSLTTRMLEKSILESAGFDVDVAMSAEEGLESARRKSYGLFLVDIEMPGMDGFTFIERIRSETPLRDIPAILVTSRRSPEDRRRAERVGAQGFIVKSEFNQVEFLGRIRQLVGG
jgi:two-component system, chemotaxis family, sensor kinase CheA